jgi:serine/threonine protein kinase
VILVNLTCGRNPWKQASFEDSTYRAYVRSPGFLKTILPLSDELDDILSRIFTRDPAQRIALPELRARIMACSRFTAPPAPAMPPMPTPLASPEPLPTYVDCNESAIEEDDDDDDDTTNDDFDFDAPLSPAASDCSDDSACSSDDGSLTSSCSSLDDLEEDDLALAEEIPEAVTPPPQPMEVQPLICEPEESRSLAFAQDFAYQYPQMLDPMPRMHHPQPCAPKFPPFQLFRGMDMFSHLRPIAQLVPLPHQVQLLT